VCGGVVFSVFSGISLVISWIVDSLNLFGMPGLLLAGFIGRIGDVMVCPLFPLCSLVGSQLWMGFGSRAWRDLPVGLSPLLPENNVGHNTV
jgi:hypothetical protein